MATFNVEPPQTQDPDWLRQSHVVEPPKPIPVIENKSAGQALTNIGAGLEGAVGLIDTSIKKFAEKESYASVDPIRDKFTAGLEGVKSKLDQGVIPGVVQGPAGTVSGKSILDTSTDDTPEVPAAVSGGLDRIDQLAQAKAAGSVKLNDTQYAKDVLSEAKRIRALVPPGYRSYVDEQISKASGLPVANSYMTNLMQDINHQLTLLGKTKDDTKTMMESNPDVPGMKELHTQYVNGQPGPDGKPITQDYVFGQVASYRNLQAQQKIDSATHAAKVARGEDTQKEDEATLIRNLQRKADFYYNDKLSISNMAGLGSLMHWFVDDMAHEHDNMPMHDTEVKQRVYQLQSYYQGVYSEMQKDSQDLAATLGTDKVKTHIENTLKPLKDLITLSNDPKSSAANLHGNMIEGIHNDDKYNYLASRETGPVSRALMTNRDILGDQFFAIYADRIMAKAGPDGKTLDAPIQRAFEQEAIQAIAPILDKRGQPLPRYLKDSIQHGKNVDLDQLETYVGKSVQLFGSIVDPKMPQAGKEKLINWAMNPKGNANLLDELKMDYIDPNTGEKINGKYHAFNLLTSSGITNAVREAAIVKPELYGMYRETAQNEFGSLYKQTILELNKLVDKPYLGVHFSWNDKTTELGLVDKNNRPIQLDPRMSGRIPAIQNPDAKYIATALDKLKDLNEGIGHLATIHKNDPRGGQETDTSKYLFRALQTMKFSGGDVSGGPSNTINNIQRAMMKARSPELSMEDLDKLLLKKGE